MQLACSHAANESVTPPCTGPLQHGTTGTCLSLHLLLKMVLIITMDKIKKFLAAGNDIAIPILSLVKDNSGAFPPLQLAATGALFIATSVKVSSVYPKSNRRFCRLAI